jgi:hypothetical protein
MLVQVENGVQHSTPLVVHHRRPQLGVLEVSPDLLGDHFPIIVAICLGKLRVVAYPAVERVVSKL